MSRGVLLLLGLVTLALGHGLVLGMRLLAPLPELGDELLVHLCSGSIPAQEATGWRIDARVHFVQHPGWRARNLRLQLPATLPAPRLGECWQYAARLSQPRSAAAMRTLLRNHLSGYARVSAGPLNQRLALQERGLSALRADLARRIGDQIADPAAAALVAALAVGATGDLGTRQWQVFNATGITHLIAISGMHVTFFAVLAMAAARRVWRKLAPRPWLPARNAFASVVGCVLALLYALLAGFSVPAQRTVWMLVAYLGVRQCARHASPLWSIAVALAAVLLLDPMAPLSAGFWLSFVAVTAIVLLPGGRLLAAAPLNAAFQLQWLASLALLPITVAMFGSFPAIGLAVNLVAIPVFSFLLVPPVLVATAFCMVPGAASAAIATLLLKLAGWVAAVIWPWLAWCADLPAALWHASPPLSWYLLVFPAILLALLPVGSRARLSALVLVGSAFLLRAPRPHPGQLWVDAYGQGASGIAVLRTHEHLLLLGTGEVHASGGQRFVRRVLPLLRSAGYAQLDLWLTGTLTPDVHRALVIAAAELRVGMVMAPPAKPPPPEFKSCSSGNWQWEGVQFHVQASGDGRACVLAVNAGGSGIEFVGNALAAGSHAAGDEIHLVLDTQGLALRSGRIGL